MDFLFCLQDRLLEEQKSVLKQIHDERTALAEERASFNMTRHLVTEESNRLANRNMRSELEVESTVKAINSEKERLNEWQQDLQKEKSRLEAERLQLRQDRETLRADEQQLENLALNVKQRSQEVSEITNVSSATKRH